MSIEKSLIFEWNVRYTNRGSYLCNCFKYFFKNPSLFWHRPKYSEKNLICCRKCHKVCEISENMLIMKRTLCVKMHIFFLVEIILKISFEFLKSQNKCTDAYVFWHLSTWNIRDYWAKGWSVLPVHGVYPNQPFYNEKFEYGNGPFLTKNRCYWTTPWDNQTKISRFIGL
jgi:hypothetical protein